MPSTYFENRYEIIEEIAEGGEGRIYKAYDHAVDRVVALKEISASRKSTEAALREARAIARISHPNVVQLYDVIEEDGHLYLVIEYVEGQTLREIIERFAPLPFQAALGIFIQLASAVEFAHNHGILHLDIKPENILVTQEGRVKLADFGLSRFIAEEEYTDKIMGSTHYIAPEALKGRYTVRSDIFSLGVVLYEMLAGKNPFFSYDPEESFKKIINYTPPPISSLRDDIPEDFDAVLKKALDKSQIRRFEDVTRFRIKVERYFTARSFEEPVRELLQTQPARPVVQRRINLRRLFVGKTLSAAGLFATVLLLAHSAYESVYAVHVLLAFGLAVLSFLTAPLASLLTFLFAAYLTLTWSIGFSIAIAVCGIVSFVVLRDVSPRGARAFILPPLNLVGLEFAAAALTGASLRLRELAAFLLNTLLLYGSLYFLFAAQSQGVRLREPLNQVGLPLAGKPVLLHFGLEAVLLLAAVVLSYLLGRLVRISHELVAILVLLAVLLVSTLVRSGTLPFSLFQAKVALSLLGLLIYTAAAELYKAYRGRRVSL